MQEPFWSINAGNVLAILTIAGFGFKIISEIASVKIKIEILWDDYVSRKGVNSK